MISQLKVVEETGVPGENHRLTPRHWQLSHMPRPGFEPWQWWEKVRQTRLQHPNILGLDLEFCFIVIIFYHVYASSVASQLINWIGKPEYGVQNQLEV